MKKIIIATLFLMVAIDAPTAIAQSGMATVQSEYSVDDTTDRLEKILKEKGLTIFKIVNHQEGAASVNMELPPTIVVIFGNPKLGTPLMQCAPSTAIDLPQKMLIWQDQEGNTHIGYNTTEYLKTRHNIKGCDQQLAKISNALQTFAQTAAGNH